MDLQHVYILVERKAKMIIKGNKMKYMILTEQEVKSLYDDYIIPIQKAESGDKEVLAIHGHFLASVLDTLFSHRDFIEPEQDDKQHIYIDNDDRSIDKVDDGIHIYIPKNRNLTNLELYFE